MRTVVIAILGGTGGYFSDSYKSYLIGLFVGVICMVISLIDRLIKEEEMK